MNLWSKKFISRGKWMRIFQWLLKMFLNCGFIVFPQWIVLWLLLCLLLLILFIYFVFPAYSSSKSTLTPPLGSCFMFCWPYMVSFVVGHAPCLSVIIYWSKSTWHLSLNFQPIPVLFERCLQCVSWWRWWRPKCISQIKFCATSVARTLCLPPGFFHPPCVSEAVEVASEKPCSASKVI